VRRDIEAAEIGRVGRIGPAEVLAALGSVKQGKIYDLDAGRFNGMPQWDGHPEFLVQSYRTPSGSRRDADISFLEGAGNADGLRFQTDLLIGGTHTGTHIDALCHVTSGKDGDRWFGGYGPESLGDFGPQRADAASIPPIVVRAALLDIARLRSVDCLPPGTPIGIDDLLAAESAQVRIPDGGAVLVRTGLMSHWPDAVGFEAASGAGLTLDAAQWLADERGVVLVGADTPTVEQIPTESATNPHPVHDLLLRTCGVHLLENAWLEELGGDVVGLMTLVCLPLNISGATGSMVRPIALV
jgi:kynurenine formamidase